MYPDSGGFLGHVEGAVAFTVTTTNLGQLELPPELQVRGLIFHELATGDTSTRTTDSDELVEAISGLDENDLALWAMGLAQRIQDHLGANWTVRLRADW
jgi:hypothetical protein